MKATRHMTPEERAKISEATKARMADPAVRQRIRDGMQAASGEANELRALRAAWRDVRPAVRKRFLNEILAAALTAFDVAGRSSTDG